MFTKFLSAVGTLGFFLFSQPGKNTVCVESMLTCGLGRPSYLFALFVRAQANGATTGHCAIGIRGLGWQTHCAIVFSKILRVVNVVVQSIIVVSLFDVLFSGLFGCCGIM